MQGRRLRPASCQRPTRQPYPPKEDWETMMPHTAHNPPATPLSRHTRGPGRLLDKVPPFTAPMPRRAADQSRPARAPQVPPLAAALLVDATECLALSRAPRLAAFHSPQSQEMEPWKSPGQGCPPHDEMPPCCYAHMPVASSLPQPHSLTKPAGAKPSSHKRMPHVPRCVPPPAPLRTLLCPPPAALARTHPGGADGLALPHCLQPWVQGLAARPSLPRNPPPARAPLEASLPRRCPSLRHRPLNKPVLPPGACAPSASLPPAPRCC
jgi:hypothetical protein